MSALLRRPRAANDGVKSPNAGSGLDQQAPARHIEEERLDAALANVPHGLCIFDADRRLLVSNSRYGEMYRLPPELLLPGTPLAKIVAYRAQIGNAPVNFPGYATHDGIDFNKEGNSLFEFRLQDGRTVRVNHLALKDGGYVATHEDVSAAVRNEARFRSIFDAVSDGIFILDAASATFIEVNKPGCLMLGYTAEELVGKDVQALSSEVAPYTRPGIVEWIQKAGATGQPQRFDWQSKSKDGRLFPVQISMRFGSIGGDEVVLAIVRDLTEREVMEAQLRQAQKMEAIGQLTGGMAHDFNNLLSIIIGNLDFLAEELPARPELEEPVKEALDAALQGADLTKRLLAFARLQPLQPQRIDVNELVLRMSKLLRRTLVGNIEITLDRDDGVWPVVADPAQLEASLVNIVNNARDAMPRGGVLSISTTNRSLDEDYVAAHPGLSPGDYAMIEISDSGTGIPPEILGRIFEPFFTTKEQGKGTGLGLSMVFGFMKQSGGHINVYSEVGVGTTFRLYLPRAAEAAAAAARSYAVTPLERGGHETILAVEDNGGLLRILAGQLKELGYRLLEAEDGPSALRILEAEPVDLLFTDIVMPGGISGYDLARTAFSRWPAMKVVLTSGFPEVKLNGNGGPPVNLRLLVKPYRKADLARILREVLDA
jgi:PAS domain S-box-containing protein